jgi:hypothetical protein
VFFKDVGRSKTVIEFLPSPATILVMRRYHVLGSAIFREEELVAALGLRPGNQVDLSALKKAADQLMQTGALATLNYTYTPLSSGIVVEYQVIDAAEFLPCRYENIVWVAMKVKPRKYIPIQATDWSKSSKVISKD